MARQAHHLLDAEVKDELARQTAINLELRRKLERVRRETVEYCAKFCEDNVIAYDENNPVVKPAIKIAGFSHPGDQYAAALRGIIRK